MEIEHLSYNLEFSFSEKADELESFYSASGFFSKTLEALDRELSATIGLDLVFTRKLKDLGSHSFTFFINVDFIQNPQTVLGENFQLKAYREWSLQVRQILVDYIVDGQNDVDTLLIHIAEQAEAFGISESFLYTPVSREKLEALVFDFSNALHFLGGVSRICFS